MAIASLLFSFHLPTGVENPMRNTYLVCYDICEDKRLRRVFKAMRDFGDHLQYSIFECQFTATDLVRCRQCATKNWRRLPTRCRNLAPANGFIPVPLCCPATPTAS